MPATSKFALPYPSGTDPVSGLVGDLQGLADGVDAAVPKFGSGAALPDPNTTDYDYWFETTVNQLFRREGTTWLLISGRHRSIDQFLGPETYHNVNSTVVEDLYSVAIPGGTLEVGDVVRIHAEFEHFWSSNVFYPALTVNGVGTVTESQYLRVQSAVTGRWTYDVGIVIRGATDQLVTAETFISDFTDGASTVSGTSFGGWGTLSSQDSSYIRYNRLTAHSLAAENLSNTLTVALRGRLAAANAGFFNALHYAETTLIKGA